MNRNLLNFFVDLVSLLAMLVLIVTGTWLWLVLPPGSRGGHGLELWGWGRHDWGDLHFWTAAVLVGLMILHVALHWDWVCAVIRIQLLGRKDHQKKPSATTQNLYGVAFLIILILFVGGFWWLADQNVTRSGDDDHDTEHARVGRPHDQESYATHISGRTTLGELAEMTNTPIEALRIGLRLPTSVGPDERLGQLRQAYGFTMEDARAFVASLQEDELP